MKHMVSTATVAVTPATAERDAAHWDEALPTGTKHCPEKEHVTS